MRPSVVYPRSAQLKNQACNVSVHQHNSPHQQNKGEKPYDHLNDVEEAFYKMHQAFMPKNVHQMNRKERFSLIKSIYTMPTANAVILNSEKLNSLLLTLETRCECPLL